jgi:hypothetical protein
MLASFALRGESLRSICTSPPCGWRDRHPLLPSGPKYCTFCTYTWFLSSGWMLLATRQSSRPGLLSADRHHGSVFNGPPNWHPQVLSYGVFQYFERSRRSWDVKKKDFETIRAASEKCGIVVSVVGIAGSRFPEVSTVLCPRALLQVQAGAVWIGGRAGCHHWGRRGIPRLPAACSTQAPSLLGGERQ